MQSFLSETVLDILKTTKSFENAVFILPSQRAGVFAKQYLKANITGFLPEILTIEQFVETVSELKKIDTIPLLVHFYSIYKEQEPNPIPFDAFTSWAFTVLQDFNEIDQHLIDTKDIFIYLRDIQRLRKWSTKGTFNPTELVKDHFSFMEKLEKYHAALYNSLYEKKVGYQGMHYREATQKIARFMAENKNKKFFLIGFNALNKAEEFLFQEMLLTKKTEIYWDIDRAFLEGNHQAGNFIRAYKKKWKYYHDQPIKIIGNWFEKEKQIEIIGAPKNVAQIKYASAILEKLPHLNHTAIVLADESLLPITLNSLPQKVSQINITMGYPLKNIPTTNLISAIFQLFLTQKKLQKTDSNLFYHKDVLRFLKNPSIYKLLTVNHTSIADEISYSITKENTTFISQSALASFFSKIDDNSKAVLIAIFNPYTDTNAFLDRIVSLIQLLKKDASILQKEFLFRYFTVLTQLKNLHQEFGSFQDLKTITQSFNQIITTEKLHFKGEPLQGLQLMGMLETRVLDFENIIITSVNEGLLPANHMQNTFIPFDVKVQFGLPTYREKDAVFLYHFFRLIQRAKNVYILYNTEPDTYGSGEKSRFLTQLELMRSDYIEKVVSPKVITTKKVFPEIAKSNTVIEQLKCG